MKTNITILSLLFIANVSISQAQDLPDSSWYSSKTELLAHLIQFESVAGEESKVGKFLVAYCEKKGLYVHIFHDKPDRFNFTASLYPLTAGKPNIVLQSHLDVVPAGNKASWQYPPFAGKVADEYVWGRGAIDCKGLLVMQLVALCGLIDEAKRLDLPYNVSFLGLSGEETGGREGADIITTQYLSLLNPVVVLGEGGAGLQKVVPSKPDKIVFGISVAEKSSLWLRVTARSKRNGHGSVPPKLYAAKRLLRGLINVLNDRPKPKFSPTTRQMFRTLGKLEGGFKGFVIRHANVRFFRGLMRKYFEEGALFYPLVYNTITITDISSNKLALNQIANHASAILDCRLLPETNIDKFIKKLKHKLGGINRIEVEVLDQSPHAPTSQPDKFYAAMAKSLQKTYPDCAVVPILFPAGSDNNYFRAKNIPTFGILPALLTEEMMNTTHNFNERISIKALEEGTRTYQTFLYDILEIKP